MPDSMSDSRLVCFVVMGFGKKTNYETGRTVNLDKTYEAIIKPAVEGAGYRCVRADSIQHSGIIDTPMYEMLLQAEVVIADVTTGNVNAVYELGVRHALRPNTTIVMMEKCENLRFDLNHISTFMYEHLGDDIGYTEALRAQSDLQKLLEAVMASPKPDSPVYTFLPKLSAPRLSIEEFQDLVEEVEAAEASLATFLDAGQQAMKEDRFKEAIQSFENAERIRSNDPYIIQQLALATYKSKSPSVASSLGIALSIINRLDPDNSNDPETLGIAGAIHKRLWEYCKDRKDLDRAISYYGRGFEVRHDYYNGENLATCLDFRRQIQHDAEEAIYDKIRARKVREKLAVILKEIEESDGFNERSDKKWVFATHANVLFALGNIEIAKIYEERFQAEGLANWELETYLRGKEALCIET